MFGIYYFLIFISGCFFGSFLKVVADRTVKGQSIVFGRSKCDSCNKYLGPLNLIPIISYIMQGGKCSSCGKKFSVLYPLSEFITGSLFAGTAVYLNIFQNFNADLLIYFVFLLVVISLYIVMIFSDISYFIIPDSVVYFAITFVFLFITVGLLRDIYDFRHEVLSSQFGKYLVEAGYVNLQIWFMVKSYLVTLVSAFLIGLFFFILVVITKGKGMGGGDVKLGLLIGLFHGFPYNVLGIFLGFIFGSVFSLTLILLKKKTIKDIIPFGPFLIAGSLVSLFFGRFILNWYLGLM